MKRTAIGAHIESCHALNESPPEQQNALFRSSCVALVMLGTARHATAESADLKGCRWPKDTSRGEEEEEEEEEKRRGDCPIAYAPFTMCVSRAEPYCWPRSVRI